MNFSKLRQYVFAVDKNEHHKKVKNYVLPKI